MKRLVFCFVSALAAVPMPSVAQEVVSVAKPQQVKESDGLVLVGRV